VIGGTDWIDGFLARRLGQVSKLGRILDPVADRLAIIAAVVAGSFAGILPVWLVLGLLVRETIVGAFAIWLLLKHRKTIDVRWIGKLATFLLYGSIPAFYLVAAGVAESFLVVAANLSGSIGLVLYWAVAISYVADVRQAARNSLSSEPPIEKGPDEHS
jgi:cardiolipin synthase